MSENTELSELRADLALRMAEIERLRETISVLNAQIEAAPRWVSCSERLPDTDGMYLVYWGEDVYSAEYFGRGDGGWGNYANKRIVAWMTIQEVKND